MSAVSSEIRKAITGFESTDNASSTTTMRLSSFVMLSLSCISIILHDIANA